MIDVLVSTRRDAAAAREFFTRALRVGPAPVEVTTAGRRSSRGCSMSSCRRLVTSPSSTRTVSWKPTMARLKARLRPMRGLKQLSSARTITPGHAFVQNLRRGHYAITADLAVHDRVRTAFDELALCL
ncbi:MAG: transposase [Actinomycetota bacterium]|nr:transposase [Actinomycetota bacterium]